MILPARENPGGEEGEDGSWVDETVLLPRLERGEIETKGLDAFFERAEGVGFAVAAIEEGRGLGGIDLVTLGDRRRVPLPLVLAAGQGGRRRYGRWR